MKIQDKKELVKLVSYMVMGDGGLYIAKEGANAKFIMNMVKENEDYVLFCRDVLENVTGTYLYERRDYNTDGCTRKPQIRLESQTHPFLTTIRDRVYTGKYKGIDPHALKLLDMQALAILYMCDGCLHIEKPNPKKGLINNSYQVTLNLKRLSYGDLFILKKALKEKLDLEWNIQKHYKYYFLYLRTKDVDKFMEGVAPFVTASFQRKIKEDFRSVSP
jgi:hypothetical protein